MPQVLDLDFKVPSKEKVSAPFEAVSESSRKAVVDTSRMEAAISKTSSKMAQAMAKSNSEFRKAQQYYRSLRAQASATSKSNYRLADSQHDVSAASADAVGSLSESASAAQASSTSADAAASSSAKLAQALAEVSANTGTTVRELKSMHFTLTLGIKMVALMYAGMAAGAITTYILLKRTNFLKRAWASLLMEGKKLLSWFFDFRNEAGFLGGIFHTLKRAGVAFFVAILPFLPTLISFAITASEKIRGLSTLLKETLGDTARNWEIELHNMAYETQTNVDTIGDTIHQMSWYFGITGASAEEARVVVTRLVQGLKIYGATAEEVTSTMDKFNESISTGKVSAGLIQDLWSKQPALFRELADAVAFSGHEIEDFTEYNHNTAESMVKLANKGKLGVDVLKQFNKELIENKDIQKDFEERESSFSEIFENMKSAMSSLFLELKRWPVVLNKKIFILTVAGKSLVGFLKGVLTGITAIIRGVAWVFQQFNKAMDWLAKGFIDATGWGEDFLKFLGLTVERTNDLTAAEKDLKEQRAEAARELRLQEEAQEARLKEIDELAKKTAEEFIKNNRHATMSVQEQAHFMKKLHEELKARGATEQEIHKAQDEAWIKLHNQQQKKLELDDKENQGLLKQLGIRGSLIASEENKKDAILVTSKVQEIADRQHLLALGDLSNLNHEHMIMDKKRLSLQKDLNAEMKVQEKLTKTAQAGLGGILALLVSSEKKLWAMSVGNAELAKSYAKTSYMAGELAKVEKELETSRGKILQVTDGVVDSKRRLGLALKQTEEAEGLATKTTKKSIKTTKDATDAERERIKELKRLKGELKEIYDEQLGDAVEFARTKFKILKTSYGYEVTFGKLTRKVYGHTRLALEEAKDALREKYWETKRAGKADRAAAKDQDRYGDSVRDTTKSIRTQTKYVDRKTDSVEDLTDAVEDAIDAEYDFGKSIKYSSKTLSSSTDYLDDYTSSKTRSATATDSLTEAEKQLADAVRAHDFGKMYEAQVKIAEAKERVNDVTNKGIEIQGRSNRMLEDTIDLNRDLAKSHRDAGKAAEDASKKSGGTRYYDKDGNWWTSPPPEDEPKRKWPEKPKFDQTAGRLDPSSNQGMIGTPRHGFSFGSGVLGALMGSNTMLGHYASGDKPYTEGHSSGRLLNEIVEKIAKGDVSKNELIAEIEADRRGASAGEKGVAVRAGNWWENVPWEDLIGHAAQATDLKALNEKLIAQLEPAPKGPWLTEQGMITSGLKGHDNLIIEQIAPFVRRFDNLYQSMTDERREIVDKIRESPLRTQEDFNQIHKVVADQMADIATDLAHSNKTFRDFLPFFEHIINREAGLLETEVDYLSGINTLRRQTEGLGRELSREEAIEYMLGKTEKNPIEGARSETYKDAMTLAGVREDGSSAGGSYGGGSEEQALNEAQSRQISLLENELRLRDSFARSIARQVTPIGSLPHSGETAYTDQIGGTASPVMPEVTAPRPPPSISVAPEPPPIEVTVVIDPAQIVQAGLETTDTDTDNAVQRATQRSPQRDSGPVQGPRPGSVVLHPRANNQKPFVSWTTNPV